MTGPLHLRAGTELSAQEVYGIWRIRDLVFAFEQRCDEPDVDGLDLLASTAHLWFADDEGITSYLRSYPAPDGMRKLGRVATRLDQRGRGRAGALLRAAHDHWGHEEIRIGAQAYLESWYGSFGYERCGADFIEAGISHVPMRRPARTSVVE